MSRTFSRWLATVTRHAQGSPRRPLRRTPQLECLEVRTVPSTLTVQSGADHGPGSLRDVLAAAHSGDTIVFAHSVHDITLTSGQLAITTSLNIDGPGAGKLTVRGIGTDRVFDISNGANVSIDGVTIADGGVTGDESGPLSLGGGGILNEAGATLTLDHCVVTDNTATAASAAVDVFGGGLLNEGTAFVISSTFSGNQAVGGGGGSFFAASVGGGIDNYGGATLTVTDSAFVGNQAVGAPGNFGIGGAIENNSGEDLSSPSTANISDSYFTDNVAGPLGNGGAIDNEGPGALMTLSDSLLYANLSGGTADGASGGGGGFMSFADSTTNIVNTTIDSNRALGGAGQTQNGGGIENQSATLTLTDSVVQYNQSVGGAGGTGFDNTALGEGLGGGIMNVAGATMTVLDSAISGNQAVGGANAAPTAGQPLAGGALGGGVENLANSSLTMIGTTVVGNAAVGGNSSVGVGGSALGGGIENDAGQKVGGGTGGGSSLTLIDCTVAANAALGGNGGNGFRGGLGAGGGLDDSTNPKAGNASTATIIGSIFIGNSAVGGDGGSGAAGGDGVGGAIAVGSYSLLFSGFSDPSAVSLTDGSALEGNTAQGGRGGNGADGGAGLGGGLSVQAGASATVSTSTITHNQALGGEEGTGGHDGKGVGGGIYDIGVLNLDSASVVKKNDASTSNDNIFT